MKCDLLLVNANVYCGKGELLEKKDMAILDGKIILVSENIDKSMAKTVIDCTDKMISPSFIDTHMHIDLSYTYDYKLDVPSLIGGCSKLATAFLPKLANTYEEVYEELFDRCAKTIDSCLVNGTTALKTNVTNFDEWGKASIVSIVDLKKRYKGVFDVYNAIDFNTPYASEYFYKEMLPHQYEMLERNDIDFIGGYPYKHPDFKKEVDNIFAIAEKYNLPIDIHCDESDVPILECFEYVLDKIIETNMQGRVTLGHLTALSASTMNEETAKSLIEKAAQAKINVTSLTSCNMYLMNENRRGPTRVMDFVESGVNVAIASDDIQEILRPYGNCDLLEEARLTAQIHKMTTTKLMRDVFDMITYNAAKNAMIEGYGSTAGSVADLVIIDAKTPEDAIYHISKRSYVIKNGKIVVENGVIIDF